MQKTVFQSTKGLERDLLVCLFDGPGKRGLELDLMKPPRRGSLLFIIIIIIVALHSTAGCIEDPPLSLCISFLLSLAYRRDQIMKEGGTEGQKE